MDSHPRFFNPYKWIIGIGDYLQTAVEKITSLVDYERNELAEDLR